MTDGHIRLLPLHVANKIAAGEVVERPASVLKELLENALDAGSTRIEAEIVQGGRKLVSVRDNGCGMSREDALLALERQATSKIRDVDDIERISTLGFRGEAIPSIAAVSRFTLITRRAEAEEATRLVVNAGTVAEVAACGAPSGTRVEVRDLFCNVPARRKFLRAYATEEAHVKTCFITHALAHPDIGFALLIDGREIFRLAPGATLEERIHALFGADFADTLVPIEGSFGNVKVHGYIERPHATVTFRHDQYVFTNGRPATASTITYAVREAYPRRREEARPTLILFLDLPPDQVDVNVHPTKREVRFRRPADVREAIMAAISATLNPAASEPAVAPVVPNEASPGFAIPFSTPVQEPLPSTTPTPVPSREETAETIVTAPAPVAETPPPVAPSLPQDQPETVPNLQSAKGPWRWYRYLGTTETNWVLLETDAGIVILNPQAASERIAYEQLLESKCVVSQPLLLPETVRLPPAVSTRLKSFLDILTQQGFVLEEFGRDTWKVDAVPQILGSCAVAETLTSIANDIAEGGGRHGGTRWRDELIARLVAKAYARTSGKLTPEAAVKLVETLATCRMPYVCPRGKPVMVFYSTAEIKRKCGSQK